ncbi:DUF58 domain-containing protein [Halobellus ordinarius]|uniref:DUF58 domain-containing protein n=1 Tax=Halobellus ordinarius TaxID=3075120 RepID=UPI00288021DE|nr:DUF58 domain-containing protein [Halobellus sp. ZY16]
MRPTRRAYVVLAVVAGAIVSGSLFGARSLDAVVVPALVALVAAVVQVWRAPTPTIERTLPPARPAGTSGTVDLRLDAPRSYPATVSDRLPPGIDGDGGGVDGDGRDPEADSDGEVDDEDTEADGDDAESTEATAAVVDATIGGDSVSYEITPRRRGEHEIGPATVVVTDVLGLVARTIRVENRGTLLAFPPIRRLAPGARTELLAASGAVDPRPSGRDMFDGLREYVPGDALRDVHWKSSAKRGALVVQEFAGEPDRDRVVVAAGLGAVDGGGQRIDSGNDGVTAGDRSTQNTRDTESDDRGTDPHARGPRPDTGGIPAGAVDAGDETGPAPADLGSAQIDVETVDAMAEAAATVCLSVLDDGVPVSLITSSGTVTASPGAERPILDHLATAEGGPVPAVDADIVVTAAAGTASIRAGGVVRSFADLLVTDSGSLLDDSNGSGANDRERPIDRWTGNNDAVRSRHRNDSPGDSVVSQPREEYPESRRGQHPESRRGHHPDASSTDGRRR